MTTFHDALTGKKMTFNFKTKATNAPYTTAPWCENAKSILSHDFPDMDDEQSQCIRCRATLLFVRAKENMEKKK